MDTQDTFNIICSYLTKEDLFRLSWTCQKWRQWLKGDNYKKRITWASYFIDPSQKNQSLPEFHTHRVLNKELYGDYSECLITNKIPPEYFLRSNKWLREITIVDVSLKSLPKEALKGCRGLLMLSIRNNNTEDLPEDFFDYCPKLRYLNLSANKFGWFPLDIFKKCPKLSHLDLSENDILDGLNGCFLGPHHVNHLNISNNGSDYGMKRNLFEEISGDTFVASHGNLREIPRLNFKKIIVSYNSISDFDLLDFPSLTYLDVSHNKLRNLESTIWQYCPFEGESPWVRENLPIEEEKICYNAKKWVDYNLKKHIIINVGPRYEITSPKLSNCKHITFV